MPMLQDYKFRIGREQLGSVAIEDMGLGFGHLPSLRSVTVLGLLDFEDDDEATKDNFWIKYPFLKKTGIRGFIL
jgi:hypothetical protein